MSRTNEILDALLGDDSEDAELLKHVASGPTEQELDVQLAKILPALVKAKEAHLGKANTRITTHTNPHGQTFCYGQFGRGKARVTATLAYLDPEEGWKPDNWHGVMESEDAGEYKDLYPQGTPRNFIPFGTLVHGTMREEDLIPDFLDAIEKVDPVKAADLRKNHAVEIAAGDVAFCWETLLTALNRYVPEFAYFGAHPGNGSDFGVWPDYEAIREAAEFEPEKMRTIAQGEPLTTGSQYVAILNKDGYAVALIDGASGQELWSYDG